MKRHLVIHEEMLDYDLRGSELLAYALVWGFSQDGESTFHGSAEYVARWCKVSRQQAVAILRSLTEKGYLLKTEYPGHPAQYVAVDPWDAAPAGGVSNNLTGGVKKFDRGCQETLHPSPSSPSPSSPAPSSPTSPISPSPEYTPSPDVEGVNTRTPARTGGMTIQYYKGLYGEKVMLTRDEHAKLVERFGEQDAARLIEILDNYLVNHPRKRYESHYRAILAWCVEQLNSERLTEQRLQNAREAGQRIAPQPQQPSDRTTLEDVKRTMDRINAKYRR